MKRLLGMTMAALAAGLGLTLASGCADMGKLEDLQRQTHELRNDLEADVGRWEEAAQALPPDSPERGAVEAGLATSQAKLSAIDAANRTLDEAVRAANNPDDPVARILGWVTPWVPAPFRAPVVLGGALLATIARAHQFKRAASSIAQGIDVAMREDEQFKEHFKRHANTFKLAQTETAAKIVDRVAAKPA